MDDELKREQTPLMADEPSMVSEESPTRRDSPLSVTTYLLFLIFAIGAAWMIEDGMWIELSYFQQVQPEGTTLSNKMTVAEAMVVFIVIPYYVYLDGKINYRLFMYFILALETISCILAAFLWWVTIENMSMMIYLVMFLTAFIGNMNLIVVQPYFTRINNRLAAVINVACQAGSLFTAILGIVQEPGDSDPNFYPKTYFLVLLAVLIPCFIAYYTLHRGYLEQHTISRSDDGTVYIYGIPTWWTLIWKYTALYAYLLVVTWVFQRSYIPYAAIATSIDGGENTDTEQWAIIGGYIGCVIGSIAAFIVRHDRDRTHSEGCTDGHLWTVTAVFTGFAAIFFWIAAADSNGVWSFVGANEILIAIVSVMRFIYGFVIPVLLVRIDEQYPSTAIKMMQFMAIVTIIARFICSWIAYFAIN